MGGMTTPQLPQLMIPANAGYQLTVTPPVWNGRRGGWVAGEPIVTTYPTRGELDNALAVHGVPVTVIRDSVSYRDAEWGPALPVKLHAGVARLALLIYRQMSESYAAYEAECARDYANGHRPSHCEHGTYQWTEYDNICGGCEDGYSLRTPTLRRREALVAAKERHHAAKAMLAWAGEARKHGMGDVVDMAAVTKRYDELMGV